MLDLSRHFAVPAAGVAQSVALGISLLSAVPATAPTPVVNAALRLRTSTVALQTDWAGRLQTQAQSTAVRPIDSLADTAWRGLHTALQAAVTLRGTPRADAAEGVLQQVFPEGRTFLTLAHKDQWAEAERRLQVIEDNDLEPAITSAVGGTEYLEQVRTTHQSYGAALNITEAAVPSIDVDLQEGVENLRSAIRGYMLQVMAWANQDVANQSSAENALAPLVAAHEEWKSRRSGSAAAAEPSVTPETPVPEVT